MIVNAIPTLLMIQLRPGSKTTQNQRKRNNIAIYDHTIGKLYNHMLFPGLKEGLQNGNTPKTNQYWVATVGYSFKTEKPAFWESVKQEHQRDGNARTKYPHFAFELPEMSLILLSNTQSLGFYMENFRLLRYQFYPRPVRWLLLSQNLSEHQLIEDYEESLFHRNSIDSSYIRKHWDEMKQIFWRK